MYTADIMLAAGITEPRVSTFLAPLNDAADEFEVNTPMRAAIFLAQVLWESDDLKYTRELYTPGRPTPAQAKYDGQYGNTAPGDGYKYRGGGLIEITFKDNYAECSQALFGTDILVQNPALIAQPATACRSAGWFWQTRGCNEMADDGDFTGVTRRINGGLNGLSGRIGIYKAIAPAFGLSST
jgi:putative chitinase